MQACVQWLLQLSPSHGPLQSSTRVQCADDTTSQQIKKERQNYNSTKEKVMIVTNLNLNLKHHYSPWKHSAGHLGSDPWQAHFSKVAAVQ